jgi:hypothetical protein
MFHIKQPQPADGDDTIQEDAVIEAAALKRWVGGCACRAPERNLQVARQLLLDWPAPARQCLRLCFCSLLLIIAQTRCALWRCSCPAPAMSYGVGRVCRAAPPPPRRCVHLHHALLMGAPGVRACYCCGSPGFPDAWCRVSRVALPLLFLTAIMAYLDKSNMNFAAIKCGPRSCALRHAAAAPSHTTHVRRLGSSRQALMARRAAPPCLPAQAQCAV